MMRKTIATLLLAFVALSLLGCGVKVDKSVNLHFDSATFTAGQTPFIAAPTITEGAADAEAKAGDTDADATADADSTGQLAGRQHGLINVNVNQTSGTQSDIEDALKVAAEAKIAATGQGTADVSGDGGGAIVNPSPNP